MFASLQFIPGCKIRSKQHRRSRLLYQLHAAFVLSCDSLARQLELTLSQTQSAPLERSLLVLGVASTCNICCSVDHLQGKFR